MTAVANYTALSNGTTVNSTAAYTIAWPIGGASTTYNLTIDAGGTEWAQMSSGEYLQVKDGHLIVPKGKSFLLPDGAVLHVDDAGNYRIDDALAKVIYRAARMREFNPYVNASDLLAAFIRYVGSLGLRAEQVSRLPVSLFVNWLVVEAAKADGDPVPPEVTPPERHRLLADTRRPRCRLAHCRRFIARRNADIGLMFCSPDHASRQLLLATGVA